MTEIGEVRWGLVGAGDIAEKRVAPALRAAPRSRLVALSRRRPELAADFAARFGVPRVHADWRDLVRDPDIDAVYVATPVDLHEEVTVAAARAGKHVLCEKPMALDVESCDRMVEAADAAGVRLGVAYYRRLYPIVLRIRELLREGAIGGPVTAHAASFERFDPPADHPRAWILDPDRAGGGPMFDFGSHRIQLFDALFGAPAEVVGVLGSAALRRRVEDTATAVFRYPAGPIATLSVTHAAAASVDTLEIHGTEGSIQVPRLNGDELRWTRGGETRTESHPAPDNLHQPLVEQFVQAVLDGGDPVVDGRAGREVNRHLAAIYHG